MIQLTAGIIFYNDAASLLRCISSIYEGVDHIIAVDGKFTTYFDENPLSTDGSRGVCQQFAAKTVLVDCPGSEVAKRNYVLKLCNTDHLLLIDSDEYVTGNFAEFRKNAEEIVTEKYNIYSVRAKPKVGQAFWPRFWYKPQEMEYYKCHNIFKNKRTGDMLHSPTSAAELVDGITIRTDDVLRSENYNERIQRYQNNLVIAENMIRKELFNMPDNRM